MRRGGHVGGKYDRIFSLRIYLKWSGEMVKMEFSSQRREMLLFLTTNMADVTTSNQQYPQDTQIVISLIFSIPNWLGQHLLTSVERPWDTL